MSSTAEEQRDWRLQGTVPGLQDPSPLHALIARHRDSRLLSDVDASVSEQVVITHDGQRLFAYAPDRRAIEAASRAIRSALARDGVDAKLTLTHWDTRADEWSDPDETPEVAAERVGPSESRTLVALVGKGIRGEFEQTLLNYAAEAGIECSIAEHPHLLDSQVAFTVTGPRHKLDEFAGALAEDEHQTIRTERMVMASPL